MRRFSLPALVLLCALYATTGQPDPKKAKPPKPPKDMKIPPEMKPPKGPKPPKPPMPPGAKPSPEALAIKLDRAIRQKGNLKQTKEGSTTLNDHQRPAALRALASKRASLSKRAS